jgi:hypothetical protein
MSRASALSRTLSTLRFFTAARQGTQKDATGYRGFFYHFLDLATGGRAWCCELSTIDTALLVAGALTAKAYFDRQTAKERELRQRADELYCNVDWNWAMNDGTLLTHGWKPEDGFLPYVWKGYDEATILYLLAVGSPTHPIPAETYQAYTASYSWKRVYDYGYLYAGPLFIHQYSHVWIDFRGLQDAYMRAKGIDYFENSRRATLVHQQYAIRNPLQFSHHCECCWGLTASDGPGPATRRRSSSMGSSGGSTTISRVAPRSGRTTAQLLLGERLRRYPSRRKSSFRRFET